MVSTSARMLAQSAVRAGFLVDAIDCFGDADTREIAEHVLTVNSGANGFNAASLSPAVDAMLRHRRPDYVVYGSGFEATPELLAQCFDGLHLAGNSAAVVRAVKDPQSLSNGLRADGIACPPIQMTGYVDDNSWLIKRIGASGGGHIHTCNPTERIADDCYAQRHIDGQSMSALFVSEAMNCRLLGTSQHWCAQPDLLTPFQHSGLVSVELPSRVREKIADWGMRCMRRFKLQGVWGMDFIVDVGGEPQLIEINPRPTAALELFDDHGKQFEAHIESGAGILPATDVPSVIRASAVVYAPCDMQIANGFSWPAWTADRPIGGTRIERGQPLCSVLGEGSRAELAIASVKQCCDAIVNLLTEHYPTVDARPNQFSKNSWE